MAFDCSQLTQNSEGGIPTELLSKLCGCSATQRVKQIKQPRGGYINPKDMHTTTLGEGLEALNSPENVNAGLIGSSVDYMTRFMLGTPSSDVFKVSMLGAERIEETQKAKNLIDNITGIDRGSVVNAIKLSGFDVCYRAGVMGYKPVDEIIPDTATVDNVITMIKRSLRFFDIYGPKVLDGFVFTGGYTSVVSSGDGDFTTKDTLWDFKVSRSPVKKEQTLQLLMYWRMGLHSIYPEFQNIQHLGIYNPRLNTVSTISVVDIPVKTLAEVETCVIGYEQEEEYAAQDRKI